MEFPEIMTIEEVAKYLRLSERKVYELAQKGDIPCGKVGTSWRFKKSELKNYIDNQLGANKSSQGTLQPNFTPLPLSNVLTPERVVIKNKATKNEILNELIDILSETDEITSKQKLAEGIYHREQLMSTGIGMSIAIPHVRLDSVKDVVVAAAIVKDGIEDYESIDGELVKIVFMIVARTDQHAQHIKLLSQISSSLKEQTTRDTIIDSSNVEEFFKIIS
ncbi:PTS sugar transporter subunit IIA [Lentisphaerota bacterium WC36G]|nr:PTS sugar transporter subunit IIA [Lentisphaerae bacterium WC36]